MSIPLQESQAYGHFPVLRLATTSQAMFSLYRLHAERLGMSSLTMLGALAHRFHRILGR